MHKTSIVVVLLAIFVAYLTFGSPNKFLIDIEPVAYRLVFFFIILSFEIDVLSL